MRYRIKCIIFCHESLGFAHWSEMWVHWCRRQGCQFWCSPLEDRLLSHPAPRSGGTAGLERICLKFLQGREKHYQSYERALRFKPEALKAYLRFSTKAKWAPSPALRLFHETCWRKIPVKIRIWPQSPGKQHTPVEFGHIFRETTQGLAGSKVLRRENYPFC